MRSRILKHHGILCKRPYKGSQLKLNYLRYRVQWTRQRWTRNTELDTGHVFWRIKIQCHWHKPQNTSLPTCAQTLQRPLHWRAWTRQIWQRPRQWFEALIRKLNCSALYRRHSAASALLAPLIQQHRQDTILVFQQDNARAYTARLTRNIFQRNDTNVLDWSDRTYLGRAW